MEQGVLLTIVLSIIDHLRRSYRPNDRVVVEAGPDQPFRSLPVDPTSRIVPGLAVYRFGASLYYANAEHFSAEVLAFAGDDLPELRWLCVDAAAMGDVDYSGGLTLREVAESLHGRGVRLVLAEVDPTVRRPWTATGSATCSLRTRTSTRSPMPSAAFGASDATG